MRSVRAAARSCSASRALRDSVRITSQFKKSRQGPTWRKAPLTSPCPPKGSADWKLCRHTLSFLHVASTTWNAIFEDYSIQVSSKSLCDFFFDGRQYSGFTVSINLKQVSSLNLCHSTHPNNFFSSPVYVLRYVL